MVCALAMARRLGGSLAVFICAVFFTINQLSFAEFVPGRIEFLGKHTDYLGGPSLVCAIERGFTFEASPRDDDRVVITNAETHERAVARLGGDIPVRQGHWSNYPFTVCRRFGAGRGADLRFTSDLPSAAGLSSSSALVVGTYLALADVNEVAWASAEELAEYLGAVESGVGTHGGSEDHTAMLCARSGSLVQFSYAPIRYERSVPLPEGWVFVVAVSGVVAAKTQNALTAYNNVAGRAREALALLGRGTLADASPDEFRGVLSPETVAR